MSGNRKTRRCVMIKQTIRCNWFFRVVVVVVCISEGLYLHTAAARFLGLGMTVCKATKGFAVACRRLVVSCGCSSFLPSETHHHHRPDRTSIAGCCCGVQPQ